MNLKELMQHTFSDTEHVRRNTIIQIVIVTLAFILLCRVWPFGTLLRHTQSKQQAYTSMEEMQADAFTAADKKLQTVRFSQDHIYQIRVYLECSEEYHKDWDYILFRLYDDGFSCIYEEEAGFGLLQRQDGFLATPDMDVDVNRDYYYEVIVPEEIQGHILLPVGDRAALGQSENTVLYVDGIYREDISLIADFDYTKERTFLAVIGLWIIILALAGAAFCAIMWGLYQYEEYLETAVFYTKRAGTVLAALAAFGFFVFAVIMNAFGGKTEDRIIYGIAAVTAFLWFWYAVWTEGKAKKRSRLPVDRQRSLIWRNYLQTVSFGLLFYALCQYVNADREYFHFVNTRWMLIFFGIVMLLVYSERELCNYMSAIWLGISTIGAVIYCCMIEGEKELYLAKLAAAVVVIWGLVVINVARQIKKDFWKTMYVPFFAIWLVFVVFMWINRFDKAWVFVAVLPFLTLLCMNLTAAGKSRLLRNFTNGILLSFGLVMLFCLMHRPYHYWMRYRYNGIFHTVSCTGMYLVTVAGAAIGKLYGKWTDGKKLLAQGKMELFILAAVVSNIMLSMSRTALLTFGVNLLLVVILAAVSYRKKLCYVITELCVLGMAVVVSFPLMYSAIRVVPAIFSDPVRYEIEPQDRDYMLYEGDPLDSGKYMTIKRYATLFLFRFQTEEGEAYAPIQIMSDSALLASIQKNALPIPYPKAWGDNIVLEKGDDASNGRFDIYMDYLTRLTIGGHDSMMIEGKEYAHAHNSYLQVAYDFGLIAGIAFLFLCAVTLWRSIVFGYQHGKNYNIYFVPFSLIVVFGFVSLTEWAFHPCIPIGFAFLFLQMVLLQKPWSQKSGQDEKEKEIPRETTAL